MGNIDSYNSDNTCIEDSYNSGNTYIADSVKNTITILFACNYL